MEKKSNMKRAMYEMFGVGEGFNDKGYSNAPEEKERPLYNKPNDPYTKPGDPYYNSPGQPPVGEQPAASYLAPGTSFEGNLIAQGDVEIAGDFKGNVTTDGAVCLRSNIQSDISAKNVRLYGSALTGNITATGTVVVSENSRVLGNVSASELQCAGEVRGDLRASDSVYLESRSRVNGDITTGAIAVDKGAVIIGRVEVQAIERSWADPDMFKTSWDPENNGGNNDNI